MVLGGGKGDAILKLNTNILYIIQKCLSKYLTILSGIMPSDIGLRAMAISIILNQRS